MFGVVRLNTSSLAPRGQEGESESAAGPPPTTGLLLEIPIAKVFVGKTNVRKSPGNVSDLLQSIRDNGVLEPVLVRPVGDRFELVVGSRRFKAAKAVELQKIPAVVRELTDEEAIV